eukprot:CAMPEP_0117024420 /NCGR_PEP_ID=MMETSP0472-20121206/18142_1 /TAXON_ID=693140 ORGANISM="Tiarina fusus, Strain LIS" /NCGR_SAMPLE_ID=MMETSP0472 /ASSEMBLY_ACC=CAM_ASM_000603 /LENGTH=414 /DNA_ID=CAMNT_0004730855 /DNA_START=42 /DNA_END=1284 /DNA_ORIENTATION=+
MCVNNETGNKIAEVKAKLGKAEADNEKVEADIEKVEAKLESEEDDDVKKQLRQKETQLREEKTQLRKTQAQLREEKKLLNERLNIFVQQQQQHAEQEQKQTAAVHINRSSAVFVLYEKTDRGPDPIATAFAVSSSLLMTAAHPVVTRPGDDDNGEKMTDTDEKAAQGMERDFCVDNLMIGRVLHKAVDGTITVEGDALRVTLAHYHYFHDWAFLKVCEGAELTDFIPLATTQDELPPRGTLEKIYVYHCPINSFRDSRKATSVHVLPKEASVGTVAEKSLSFQNGGFAGSCGGPYVFRNKVVALHVASENDAYDFEMLDDRVIETKNKKRKMSLAEKTKLVAESCASSHASLGTGIILQVRSGLMKVYNGEILKNLNECGCGKDSHRKADADTDQARIDWMTNFRVDSVGHQCP